MNNTLSTLKQWKRNDPKCGNKQPNNPHNRPSSEELLAECVWHGDWPKDQKAEGRGSGQHVEVEDCS